MAQGFVHPEYLVETGWLAAHLNDPRGRELDRSTHLPPLPGNSYYTVRRGHARGELFGRQPLLGIADVVDASRVRPRACGGAQRRIPEMVQGRSASRRRICRTLREGALRSASRAPGDGRQQGRRAGGDRECGYLHHTMRCVPSNTPAPVAYITVVAAISRAASTWRR